MLPQIDSIARRGSVAALNDTPCPNMERYQRAKADNGGVSAWSALRSEKDGSVRFFRNQHAESDFNKVTAVTLVINQIVP